LNSGLIVSRSISTEKTYERGSPELILFFLSSLAHEGGWKNSKIRTKPELREQE
jgi:hypothetical protein